MKERLENCLCGGKAKLSRVTKGDLKGYHYIHCSKNCENDYISKTFSTRLPEFCIELWNATIRRKKVIDKIKRIR